MTIAITRRPDDEPPSRAGAAGVPRRQWTAPAMRALPALENLTLQTGPDGAPIPGNGSSSGLNFL